MQEYAFILKNQVNQLCFVGEIKLTQASMLKAANAVNSSLNHTLRAKGYTDMDQVDADFMLVPAQDVGLYL